MLIFLEICEDFTCLKNFFESLRLIPEAFF